MRSRPATRRGMMRTGEGSEGMRGARRGLRKRPGRERVAIRPRSKPTPTAWPPGAATEALDRSDDPNRGTVIWQAFSERTIFLRVNPICSCFVRIFELNSGFLCIAGVDSRISHQLAWGDFAQC
jgi:hypothetical protein